MVFYLLVRQGIKGASKLKLKGSILQIAGKYMKLAISLISNIIINQITTEPEVTKDSSDVTKGSSDVTKDT